jgi:hypothetical protein
VPTAPAHSARLPASRVAIHAQKRSQSHSTFSVAIHAQNRSQSHSTLVNGRRFTQIHCLSAWLGVSMTVFENAYPSGVALADAAALLGHSLEVHISTPTSRLPSGVHGPQQVVSERLWQVVLKCSLNAALSTASVSFCSAANPLP